MQPKEHLIVIEAPGKTRHIEKILCDHFPGKICVVATKGVLFNLPKQQIGVSPDTLLPDPYLPVHPEIVEHLRELIRNADKVWIATDPDIEGEVIAHHLIELMPNDGKCRAIHRVRFRSLAAEEVIRAFREAGTIDERQVHAGIARRTVDRIIGFLYSDLDAGNKSGAVGRVHARLLCTLNQNPPVCCRLRGSLRTQGVRWQVRACATASQARALNEITDYLHDKGKALVERCIQHDALRQQAVEVAPPQPMNYADMLQYASQQLRIQHEACDQLMQQMYEHGKLSYLRTQSREPGSGVRNATQAIAQQYGVVVRRANSHASKHPHEPLYPTRVPDDLFADPYDLGPDEALLAEAGKRLLLHALPPAKVLRTSLDQSVLHAEILRETGIDARALGLSVWQDNVQRSGWMRYNKRNGENALMFDRVSPMDMLIHTMDQYGIGRPSTMIVHAQSLLSRYQVRPDGSISTAGHAHLNYLAENTPWLLQARDPVEDALDAPPAVADAGKMAKRMLRGFGLSVKEVKQRIARRSLKEAPSGFHSLVQRVV